MEAPNKIYLEQTGEVTFNAMWFDKPTDKGFQHEYIRKDLLLAWAKEQDKNASYKFEDESGNMYWGYTIAIDELIDKLNSL